jgi:hypothetical protein
MPSVSWPALSRPTTTCGAEPTKVVDGRTKSGDDTGAAPVPPVLKLAPVWLATLGIRP